MHGDVQMLVASAVLTWVMLLSASLIRVRFWTPAGLLAAFGNRDDLPAPTPLAGRAERAARNMLENLVLLVALITAARLAGASQHAVDLGAQIFFFSRLLYFPVYLAGIVYLRTAIWAVSIGGLALIVFAMV